MVDGWVEMVCRARARRDRDLFDILFLDLANAAVSAAARQVTRLLTWIDRPHESFNQMIDGGVGNC